MNTQRRFFVLSLLAVTVHGAQGAGDATNAAASVAPSTAAQQKTDLAKATAARIGSSSAATVAALAALPIVVEASSATVARKGDLFIVPNGHFKAEADAQQLSAQFGIPVKPEDPIVQVWATSRDNDGEQPNHGGLGVATQRLPLPAQPLSQTEHDKRMKLYWRQKAAVQGGTFEGRADNWAQARLFSTYMPASLLSTGQEGATLSIKFNNVVNEMCLAQTRYKYFDEGTFEVALTKALATTEPRLTVAIVSIDANMPATGTK